MPRGHLYLKLDINPRKIIHIIRVVFQDQAMYAHTSFRGEKHAKLAGGGRCVFGHTDKFWKGHEGQIKKKSMQKRVFKVYFLILKIRVYGVF